VTSADTQPFAALSSMNTPTQLETNAGVAYLRPQGPSTLTFTVDAIAEAIGRCRYRGINQLLVNTTGLTGIAIPSLVDRFLMIEEWASVADGLVIVAMVVPAEYIHPERFGLKVAAHFGLMANVFVNEADALAWLADAGTPT
jgi:hypothetical protein